MKACLSAIQQVFDEGARRVPVMISATIFQGGRTLTGQTLEAFLAAVEHFPAFSIGMNCGIGPKQMREYVEILAKRVPAGTNICCYPNSPGCPTAWAALTRTRSSSQPPCASGLRMAG